MSDPGLLDQQICIKLCLRNKISAAQAYKMLQKAFGENAVSKKIVSKWFTQYKGDEEKHEQQDARKEKLLWDKLPKPDRLEQRTCIKFCFSNQMSWPETTKMVQKTFGDKTMAKRNILKWYNKFKKGQEEIDPVRRVRVPVMTEENERKICIQFCSLNENENFCSAAQTYEMVKKAFGDKANSKEDTFKLFAEFKANGAQIDNDKKCVTVHQQTCMKFCLINGIITVPKINRMLYKAFGNKAMGRKLLNRWYNHFKKELSEIESLPATDGENVDEKNIATKIDELISLNPQIAPKDLADAVDANMETVQKITKDTLNLEYSKSQWIPKTLSK